jgi:MFS family permease
VSSRSSAAARVAPSPPAAAAATASDEAPAPETRRNMRLSVADGAAYCVMVGFGETYFAAFALAAGLPEVTAGLAGTVPLVVGGLLQLAAPYGVRRLGSYRRWVVACASVQAAMHVPLVVAALLGRISVATLYLVVALYWAAGMSAGPAWNNWIESLVPSAGRSRFLAWRSRVTQGAALVAFLVAGALLDAFAKGGRALQGFALLFALAGAARALSSACLAAKGEAPPPPRTAPRWLDAARSFVRPGASRFLLFLLAFQVAANVSGPYFSPFMLVERRFSYAQYVALIAIGFVTKIVAYPLVPRLVRRYGPLATLVAGASCAVPLPLFWFWAPQYPLVLTMQSLSGFAWGIIELTSTLLIFDQIGAHARLRILTLHNLLNALAVVVGSTVGALLLEAYPHELSYRYVFTTSVLARIVALATLIGAAPPVRVRARALFFRVSSLRPGRGAFALPILTASGEPEAALAVAAAPAEADERDAEVAAEALTHARA